MAAITYWVDPVDGDDANDGLSFANALKTNDGLAGALISAGNGNDYTVNLTNTGNHTYSTTPFGNRIDGQVSSTFHIRGTDSSGNPAWTSVVAGATSDFDDAFLYIRENAGILLEYIKHDVTLTSTGSAFIYSLDGATGTAETRYCQFIAGALGSGNAKTCIPIYKDASQTQNVYVHHCYFQHHRGDLQDFYPPSGYDHSIYNCVFVSDDVAGTNEPQMFNLGFFAPGNIKAYNNTIWHYDNQPGFGMGPYANWSPFSGTGTGPDWYNNVIWKDKDGTSGVDFSASSHFVNGQDLGSASFSGTETIGHNVYAVGPALALDGSTGPDNYEEPPWDTGGDDLYPGDVRLDNKPDTVLFAAPNSAYDWTPPGSTLAIPLPKDLRLDEQTTAGLGGTLPGALPSALPDEISYTVVAGASDTNPEINDNISITFEVTNNSLVADADVELDVPLPAELPLTFFGSSSGTYTGGTWTVTIAAGATESLDLQVSVDPSAVGQVLTVTGTVNSTNTIPTPDVIPTADSVVITVQAETDFTVQATSTRSVAFPTDSLVLRAAIENDAGGFESDAVVNITVPSFLQVVSSTPSAGSFDESTGVWTLTIGAGDSELLTISCLVPVDTDPTSGDFTVTVDASSDPPPGGTLADDTDSTTIEILAPDITDPEAPAAAPFLDVLPIQATELLLDMNIAALTKRNRRRRDYVRSDIEEQRWRECSLRCIEIGPDTTTKLNLGGIERGQFAFVESSTQVDVSIGNATDLYISARVVVLQDGDFEQLHIRNNSTTVTATVIYGVTD